MTETTVIDAEAVIDSIRTSDLKPVTLGYQFDHLFDYVQEVVFQMNRLHLHRVFELDDESLIRLMETHFALGALLKLNSPDANPDIARALGRDKWNANSNFKRDRIFKRWLSRHLAQVVDTGLARSGQRI